MCTDEQMCKSEPADRSVLGSSCGGGTVRSVNSAGATSQRGSYTAHEVDGGQSMKQIAEVMHQPPHHAAQPLDAYSLKSYSTTSQLSTAKYDLYPVLLYTTLWGYEF